MCVYLGAHDETHTAAKSQARSDVDAERYGPLARRQPTDLQQVRIRATPADDGHASASRGDARRFETRGVPRQRRSGGKLKALADPRPCEVCGREFRPRQANVNKGCGKTCSIQCRCLYAKRFWKRNQQQGEKKRARRILRMAVESGELIKPEECTRCGGTTKRIEAHHPDYTRPREVEWLCSGCHADIHFPQRRAS